MDKYIVDHLPDMEGHVVEYAESIEDLDSEGLLACMHIGRRLKLIDSMFETYLVHYGLSASRFSVLVCLFHESGNSMTPAELAESVGLSRASMTTVLDGLESNGYIRREQHKTDRRMISVRFTQEGRDYVEEILPDHYRRLSRAAGHLTEQECRLMVGLLDKFGAGVENMMGHIK